MKSAYNERFFFDDPLSKWSACRSTRSRFKKMKTATLTEETSVAHSGVQHDSELTFAEEEGAIAKQDKVMPYNTVTKYLEGFASDERSRS